MNSVKDHMTYSVLKKKYKISSDLLILPDWFKGSGKQGRY